MSSVPSNRERWGSQTSFILASIGSAVGLGNFWRFPFLVYKWHGAIFLIPYFIFLFSMALPMLVLELSLGQVYQQGSVGSLRKVNRKFTGIAIAGILVSFLICCYYCVVMSWSLIYVVQSFYPTMPWSIADTIGVAKANEHFTEDVLHLAESISHSQGMVWPIFGGMIFLWICIFFCLFRGIKGIGKIVYATMFIPIIMLMVLLVRGMTLEGAATGVSHYIGQWDMKLLLHGQIWVDAATQTCFSLSLSLGVMQAYGSFNKSNENVVKNAMVIAFCNSLFSFLVGFVVFSIIGHLTYIQGLSFQDMQVAGPALAFVTYPAAISLMPGISANIFCIVFFVAFFTLGIDSAFSLVEGIVNNVQELSPFQRFSRFQILLTTCLLGCFASTVYASDIGIYVLELMDYYLNNFSLLLLIYLEAYTVGWHHDRKGLCALVGGTAVFFFELAVHGLFAALSIICYALFDFLGIYCVLVLVAIYFILASIGVGFSVHFGRKFLEKHHPLYLQKWEGKRAALKCSAYLLCFHQPLTLATFLNQSILAVDDNDIGTSKNMKLNIVWCFLIKFVIPSISLFLSCSHARSAVIEKGHGGHAMWAQIVMYVISCLVLLPIPIYMAAVAVFPAYFKSDSNCDGKKECDYSQSQCDINENNIGKVELSNVKKSAPILNCPRSSKESDGGPTDIYCIDDEEDAVVIHV